MSKKATKNLPAKNGNEPWISMRTGVITIAITSLAMFIMTAWQAIPLKGLVEGTLWSLLYAAMIWVIFVGFYLFRRWLRR